MLNSGALVNNKYRIVRLIGDGGMGTVYEAKHEVLGNRVALKFLHQELAEQPNLKQRFLQEAQVSASINSPHIVQVSDVDSAPEGAYLVMELLDGEPLQRLMDRNGKLSVSMMLNFTNQIINGLGAAHAQHVVHRDLKPDNVFITTSVRGPVLKLLDFGIAKLRHSEEYQMTLTRPGAVMGTPEYMAPEQAYSADLVDERSDIYSLGVMMFEMLTGQLPAYGDTPQEIAEQILKGQSAKLDEIAPDINAQLRQLITRAMAPRPEDRFASVQELSRALQPFWQAPARVPPSQELANSLTGVATAFPGDAVARAREGHSDPLQSVGAGKATDPMPEPSPVAATVPPATNEAPAASRLPPVLKTASMPEISEAAVRAAGANGPPYRGLSQRGRDRAQRRRSGWLTVLVLMLLAAGGGGFYYYSEFYQSGPTPPPQPVRHTLPPQASAAVGMPADDAEFDTPEREPDAFTSPGNDPPPRPAVGGDKPGKTEPSLPSLPPLPTSLPPIPDALASSIPTAFPTALPTSLPTFLPIPGLLPIPSAAPSK